VDSDCRGAREAVWRHRDVARRRVGSMPAPSSGVNTAWRKKISLALGLSCAGINRNRSSPTLPVGTITMVVPFAAAGPADTIGRDSRESMRSADWPDVMLRTWPCSGNESGVGRAAAGPGGTANGSVLGKLGYPRLERRYVRALRLRSARRILNRSRFGVFFFCRAIPLHA